MAVQTQKKFNFTCPKEIEHIYSKTSASGKRYYTTPNGKKLPSVTTVLGYAKRPIIEAWRARVGVIEADRISKKSSERGKRIHTICEKYLKGDSDYVKGLMPDAVSLFRGIKPYIDRIDNIHYLESRLWSFSLGMAGQVDLIAEFDGVLSVIDFKTSDRNKPEEWIDNYFCQCLAYAIMYEEIVGEPIEQIVVMMAVENGDSEIYVRKAEDYVDPLINYIKVYTESLAA